MRYFYTPDSGVVGDCIPLWHNGEYHVFYLRDFRGIDSHAPGVPWYHLATTDFLHFRDLGEAIPTRGAGDQEFIIGTGSLFTDRAGSHHLYYTGINQALRTADTHEQVIFHARSADLREWERVDEAPMVPDEAFYERHDWRDPFLYWHPATGLYHMLVAARTKSGPANRRGCTALCTSADLKTWRVREPWYAPARFAGHECPDLFRMGDWYYLVFSEYSSLTATRYVMSRSIDGPWVAPRVDRFDNRAFYAAKSASDGRRRFLFGWNPTKKGQRDDGAWEWGGCMTVHEISQAGDGSLAVRMPPAAAGFFRRQESLAVRTLGAGWTKEGTILRGRSPYAMSTAVAGKTPQTYLLRCVLRYEAPAGAFGLLLNLDDECATGYFLRIEPARDLVSFGQVGAGREWYLDRMPELDQVAQLEGNRECQLTLIVDGTAFVAYLNDRIAMSGRMYANGGGRLGLFVDGNSVSIEDLQLRTP